MSIFNDDMKPCPFCGTNVNNNNVVLSNTLELTNNRFAVVCSCGAHGPAENSEEKAKKAWTIRHSIHELLPWNPFPVSKKLATADFKGNLESVNLSSILQMLSSEKKTGILKIVNGEKRSAICLKSGKIIAASCNWGLQLGQILLDNGLISRENLQKSLEGAKEYGKPLGEVLLSTGYVGHHALMEAIRFQINEIAMDILFWKEGEFQYRDCILKFDKAGVEEISTITILFEATLKHDELDAA
jgi:Lar family restriction alleviation protein